MNKSSRGTCLYVLKTYTKSTNKTLHCSLFKIDFGYYHKNPPVSLRVHNLVSVTPKFLNSNNIQVSLLMYFNKLCSGQLDVGPKYIKYFQATYQQIFCQRLKIGSSQSPRRGRIFFL
uniref:Uncharacterized protein n=1 Tax=Cacopsylla melanoneura TaxID=428564 RepID=A0A8D9AZZ7_9HEMI